jgi:hypothetical protein
MTCNIRLIENHTKEQVQKIIQKRLTENLKEKQFSLDTLSTTILMKVLIFHINIL